MEMRKYLVFNGVRAPDQPAHDESDIRQVLYKVINWNVFICSLLEYKM